VVQGYAHTRIERYDSRKITYGLATIFEDLQRVAVMGIERRDNIVMR